MSSKSKYFSKLSQWCMCLIGLNLAIGSEDTSAEKSFSYSYMSLVTLKISSTSKNLIIPVGCPNEASVQVWL